MKKILVAIIVAVVAAMAGLLGADNVFANKPVVNEAACKSVGGEWVYNNKGPDKCAVVSYDTKEKCDEANGSWIDVGSSAGGYVKRCEVRVDDDGKAITTIPVSSHTYSNAECNVLPDIICDAKDNKDLEGSAIWQIVLFIIEILTMGVGLLALAGIVYGSVLYSSAGGNPEQVKKARTIIVNVVIGVVAYALMYALLQWIVPGGVF